MYYEYCWCCLAFDISSAGQKLKVCFDGIVMVKFPQNEIMCSDIISVNKIVFIDTFILTKFSLKVKYEIYQYTNVSLGRMCVSSWFRTTPCWRLWALQRGWKVKNELLKQFEDMELQIQEYVYKIFLVYFKILLVSYFAFVLLQNYVRILLKV